MYALHFHGEELLRVGKELLLLIDDCQMYQQLWRLRGKEAEDLEPLVEVGAAKVNDDAMQECSSLMWNNPRFSSYSLCHADARGTMMSVGM
jgi:hypothetical protein